MSERDEQLFEHLDPPAGGLAGLRRRLDDARRGRLRSRQVTLGLAAGVILVALAAALLADRPGRAEAEFDLSEARSRMGLSPRSTEALRISPAARDHQAALKVPLDSEIVMFYRVGSVNTDGAQELTGPQTSVSVP